jgi:DGQHR domain-containing protein
MAKAKKITSTLPAQLAIVAPVKKRKKKGKKKVKVKLTVQEIEQNLQKKEIRKLLSNIGFSRVPHVDGKCFNYKGRKSEMDDIFYYKNIVLFMEYTVASAPGPHLLNKKIIYDLINSEKRDFFSFLLQEPGFKYLKENHKAQILPSYSLNQLRFKIVYASKTNVTAEHKALLNDICFLDYSVVKYFEGLAKTIKKSTKYEFFHFLGIQFSEVGENIKGSSKKSTENFSGHILPEEHSSLKEGYKIVSFYIDADSLLRRAYVLRRDGWRSIDSIGFYQRMFLAKKIRDMRRYLQEEGRVFVNNIIVTLPVEKIKFTDESGELIKINKKGQFSSGKDTRVIPATIEIQDESNIIGIIDGQHRTYAYHEGDDKYEVKIAELRKIQNLLVTGILYPAAEEEEKRLKFEAQLFLEINSNQSGASSSLKQEIEFMLKPFSTTSISKHVINKLNLSGPLAGMFEEHWYEKAKLKTASIISFGLKPLVKFDGNDSLCKVWKNANKASLQQGNEDYAALAAYKEFCVEQVRDIFIGLKANVDSTDWKMDRLNPKAILNITTVNGVINCLRLLVENNKTGDVEYYKTNFKKIKDFKFKIYKTSHYRRMGEAIYNKCFTP